MIWLYRALSPLFIVIFIFRLFKGKEDISRVKERLGLASLPRPEGKLVWFHGASVGETVNLIPLMTALKADNPDLNILLTSGTKTSAELMKKRLPEGMIHQFIPLDIYPCVHQFLNHWKPDLSVFMESEFWPELLTQAPNAILINARISDKSFEKYLKHKNLIEPLLKNFRICLGREVQDTERLQQIGAPKACRMGNLKYDTELTLPDKDKLNDLKERLQGEKIILLSSTHNPEEIDLVTAIHAKPELKNCFIIIAPRHPHRGVEIEQELKGQNICRSQGALPEKDKKIYIADTIGEMPLWLNMADIVVIGGSFVSHGGQTPIEAVKSGRITITGPDMSNFTETMVDFTNAGAVISVETKGELVLKLTEYLTNDTLLKAKEESLQGAIAHLGGALKVAQTTIEKELQN